jgi:hypothetical protein
MTHSFYCDEYAYPATFIRHEQNETPLVHLAICYIWKINIKY